MVQKLKIEGIAIREGTSRNNVRYDSKELHKFANTMEGRPILKDHESRTDNVIGVVEKGLSLENGKMVRYSGWIKEDGTGILEKIKDGRIKEVSIGAQAGKLIKESEDSDVVVAQNLTCLELSTTPTPGVIGTSLSPTENYTEEKVNEIIQDYFTESHSSEAFPEKDVSNDILTIIKEDKKMESNEIKEVKVDESIALKEQLATALKEVEAMREAQRQDAINAYNAKCTDKAISAQDCSKFSMETIKALTATVDSVKKEEKVEAKEAAVPKTVSKAVESKTTEDFNGYTIERSDFGGFAFSKLY